jgi:hypothetical protein
MSILGKFIKQPGETLDYDIDFSDWFLDRADLPDSFTVVAPTGITLVSSVRLGAVVKLVLAGGTSGEKYQITVRLTTDTDLVKEADFVVSVKET